MSDKWFSIEGRVRRLVSEGLRRKRSLGEIAADLVRMLDREGLIADDGYLRANLEVEAQMIYEWVGTHLMSAEDRRMVTTLLQQAGSAYAWIGARMRNDVLRAVERGLRQDLPRREIEAAVAHAVRTKRHVAQTITRTALGGFDRAAFFREARAAGVDRFRYTGPAGEREFCRARVGKIFTLEQIRTMNNGQGLPVQLYCGGYNCRHQWTMALETDVDT